MPNGKLKLVVTGFARHGKDTVCSLFEKEFGLTFESSSFFCASRAVRPWLAAKGIKYTDLQSLYEDRVNHRSDWYDAICDYNKDDPARLGKELFAIYDVYCGLRNCKELAAMREQGVIDYVIWVDASKRLPPEDSSSISITPDMADFILDNNGSLVELFCQVISLMGEIKERQKQNGSR